MGGVGKIWPSGPSSAHGGSRDRMDAARNLQLLQTIDLFGLKHSSGTRASKSRSVMTFFLSAKSLKKKRQRPRVSCSASR